MLTAMIRSGGRKNELRELTIQYERLDRVDGSACFGFGDTKAIASVSGPIEVRLAAEHPSTLTLEVHLRPLSNVPGTESKSFSSTLRSLLIPSLILTQNPRTLVQLVVQSLTPLEVCAGNNFRISSLAAAMINASTLALLNAGSVPMRGVVCAVSVGRMCSKSNPSALLILDPSEDEIPSLGGGGCFAFLFATGLNNSGSSSVPSSEAVWNNWQSSMPFTEEELLRARDLARDGAERVWANMKQSIGSMVAPSSTHERTDRKAKIADIDIQGLEAKEDSMGL
jgi:exosome complex component RRP46